jgi:hypothetical protein
VFRLGFGMVLHEGDLLNFVNHCKSNADTLDGRPSLDDCFLVLLKAGDA